MVVTPPAQSEEEILQAMEDYRKSGRTPEQDEADFHRLSSERERHQ